jgi:carbonic anhydrase
MQDITERLIEGNRRFIEGALSDKHFEKRLTVIHEQNPFGIVLCCSDSRVPAEMIFDVDLGDLFVVRVAGNIVAPSIVGSIEYAINKLNVKFILVMGHTNCGAILSTLDCIQNKKLVTDNVKDIVERILPSVVEIAKSNELSENSKILMSTKTNIHASVNQLKHASRILENKFANGDIQIIGAMYHLESGRVEFL